MSSRGKNRHETSSDKADKKKEKEKESKQHGGAHVEIANTTASSLSGFRIPTKPTTAEQAGLQPPPGNENLPNFNSGGDALPQQMLTQFGTLFSGLTQSINSLRDDIKASIY